MLPMTFALVARPVDDDAMVAAGWYVDPSGRFEKRYYDGIQWTTTVAVGDRTFADVTDAAATARSDTRPWGITALVGGGLAVVAAFMPWAKASAGLFSASKDGIDGDGVVSLAAGAVVVVLAIIMTATNDSDKWPAVFALFGGLAILGTGAVDMLDVLDKGPLLQPGTGLYLTCIAGVIVLVGAFGALAKSG